MKKIIYPILAVVAFLVMQTLAGIGLVVFFLVLQPELMKTIRTGGLENILNTQPAIISLAIDLSGIATIAIIGLLGMINWKQVLNVKSIEWKWGTVSIVAAILGIFVLDIMEEMIDLPNLMEDQFIAMSRSWLGILSIGVAGPIIEEFIFREGILGYMLRNGMNRWVAITASALLFGIIHMNPAQIPFAAAMGFIFSIIYYKTGNIVIPSILHILNNSIVVLMMYIMGDAAKDVSFTEGLGGYPIVIVHLIVYLTICTTLFQKFWKNYQPKRINN